MARTSARVLQLAQELLRHGVVADEAVKLAQSAMNSFPSLKGRTKAISGDFAAILQTLHAAGSDRNIPKKGAAKQKGPKTKYKPGKQQEIRIGTAKNFYTVYTTLPPAFVNAALVSTLEKWVAFASGAEPIAGRSLKNPSGRYAGSMELQQRNANFFTIYSNSAHADALENGRRRFDLKDFLSSYGGDGFARIPIGHSSLIRSSGTARIRTAGGTSRMRVYSQVSKAASKAARGMRYGDKDIRTMSEHSPRGSWVIPAMRAYHPAWHLAQKLQREFSLEERLVF